MPLTKSELEALQMRHTDRVWAHALKLRHERGDALNRNQVRCYRNALGLNVPAQ